MGLIDRGQNRLIAQHHRGVMASREVLQERGGTWEDTLNRTSTIRSQMFDKVTAQLQRIEHPPSHKMVHHLPLFQKARLLTTLMPKSMPLKNPHQILAQLQLRHKKSALSVQKQNKPKQNKQNGAGKSSVICYFARDREANSRKLRA